MMEINVYLKVIVFIYLHSHYRTHDFMILVNKITRMNIHCFFYDQSANFFQCSIYILIYFLQQFFERQSDSFFFFFITIVCVWFCVSFCHSSEESQLLFHCGNISDTSKEYLTWWADELGGTMKKLKKKKWKIVALSVPFKLILTFTLGLLGAFDLALFTKLIGSFPPGSYTVWNTFFVLVHSGLFIFINLFILDINDN